MEAAVFILSLVDCCALIFLSVYFVSFSSLCFLAGTEPFWHRGFASMELLNIHLLISAHIGG